MHQAVGNPPFLYIFARGLLYGKKRMGVGLHKPCGKLNDHYHQSIANGNFYGNAGFYHVAKLQIMMKKCEEEKQQKTANPLKGAGRGVNPENQELSNKDTLAMGGVYSRVAEACIGCG